MIGVNHRTFCGSLKACQDHELCHAEAFVPAQFVRSSSATCPPQRREERPAAATAAPRREPDVRRKVWPGLGKRRQGSGGALVETPGRQQPPSRLPEGVVRREKLTGDSAPKRSRMLRKVLESDIHSVCVLACYSIKMHKSSQKELFSPHSVSAMQLATPQSSAEPPPTQRIVAHHLPAHPLTKLLKPLYQSLKAWEVIPGILRWLLGVIKHGYALQFRGRPPRFKGMVPFLWKVMHYVTFAFTFALLFKYEQDLIVCF